MNARQVWLVALREIRARLRSRAYQISTVALVVLAIGGVVALQVLPDFFEEDALQVGLLPDTADRAASLRTAAETFERELEAVVFPDPSDAAVALDDGDVDAVLAAPDRVEFRDEPDTVLEAIVRQSLFATALEERAGALGLTLEEAESLLVPVDLEVVSVRPPEEERDSDTGQGVGQISAIILLMAIGFYGQWVVVGVIEEKSNRVVEVLLAAIRPIELLVGKVLGILALALIQIVLTATALVVAVLVTTGMGSLPTVAFTGLGLAILWLVIGLLLYNFLYAAAGATVTRSEEATNVTFPLMIPLMVGYFVGLIVMPDDPDSLLSQVISIFPLTAPLTMPSRIAYGGGSALEVVIAVALAVKALTVVVWLAARIYAGGILQSSRIGVTSAFRRARDME